MTEQNETTENVGALSHSQGNPDPNHDDDDRGSDVGGPAQAGESTTEEVLTGTGTGTVGAEDDPDSQAANPN